jgi:UDP-galactopyranose mutase
LVERFQRDYDWLIVGAGLTGATLAERIAVGRGETVLVIDRRPHVAGNAYDMVDEGIRVHRYGAHIFHTSSTPVWEYLSRFTDWVPYHHRVLAAIDGQLVPLPFNLNTLEGLLGPAEAAPLAARLVDAFGYGERVPVLRLLEHPDPALAELGTFVYQSIFLNYTLKQWGRRPEELDPAVSGRVPVLVSHDDNYFRDPHQALPAEGYTTMVSRMLDHPLITVATSTDHHSIGSGVRCKRTIFTGPIDEYFDHRYGRLPYRSLRFEHEHLAGVARSQPVGTVNYPNDHAYTRITEFKHLTGQAHRGTSIVREYPSAEGDPYYPVPTAANEALFKRYQALADDEPAVHFIGRLAQYRYYNMDQVVATSLQLAARLLETSTVQA